jgi:hypothetical protein
VKILFCLHVRHEIATIWISAEERTEFVQVSNSGMLTLVYLFYPKIPNKRAGIEDL